MSLRNFGIVRKLVLAAAVGGSSLAVPVAARAQSISPERALLGEVEAAPGGDRIESARTDPGNAAIDGERALLARPRNAAPVRGTDTDSGSHISSVDGASALLSERKI
jgi:hypothetical protein